MALNDAFNRRLGDSSKVVPVAPLIEEKRPTYGHADPSTIRAVEPGEVGYKTMEVYPDIPYEEETLRALLERTQKGAGYMLEKLGTPEADKALGLLTEVLEATQLMLVGYMASSILNGTRAAS